MQPEARAAWRRILHQGWTDALRAFHPNEDKLYTFWDYTAGCWQRDAGFRIDHLLCSPEAADRLRGAGVDKWARGRGESLRPRADVDRVGLGLLRRGRLGGRLGQMFEQHILPAPVAPLIDRGHPAGIGEVLVAAGELLCCVDRRASRRRGQAGGS